MHRSRSPVATGPADRLQTLASAIEAHRRRHPQAPLPQTLRAQVVAVIKAGVPVQTVRQVCKLQGEHITRWCKRAARSSSSTAAKEPAKAHAAPRVLSVVDSSPPQDLLFDAGFELRVGGWRISVARA